MHLISATLDVRYENINQSKGVKRQNIRRSMRKWKKKKKEKKLALIKYVYHRHINAQKLHSEKPGVKSVHLMI